MIRTVYGSIDLIIHPSGRSLMIKSVQLTGQRAAGRLVVDHVHWQHEHFSDYFLVVEGALDLLDNCCNT